MHLLEVKVVRSTSSKYLAWKLENYKEDFKEEKNVKSKLSVSKYRETSG